MVNCSAYRCKSRSERQEPGISFHSFPKDLEKRKLWVANMKVLNWEPTKNDRLCSNHFEEKWLYRSESNLRRRLLNKAIPTIFPELPKYLQPKKSTKRPGIHESQPQLRPSVSSLASPPPNFSQPEIGSLRMRQLFQERLKIKTREIGVLGQSLKRKNTASNVTIATSKENQLRPFEFVDPASLVENTNQSFKSSNKIKKIKVHYDNVVSSAIQTEKNKSAFIDLQKKYSNPENISDELELEEIHEEIKIEYTDSFSVSTKDLCDFAVDIKHESCDSFRRIPEEHSYSIRDNKEENCDITGAIKEESCDSTGVINDESCDFTWDVKEESCGIAGAIKQESCNFTGDIKEESCDFTLDIKEENCDIKQETDFWV